MFSNSFLKKNLDAAKFYRKSPILNLAAIPDEFMLIDDARKRLIEALEFEAIQAFQQPRHTDTPLLCGVNLDTPNPGIVIEVDDTDPKKLQLDVWGGATPPYKLFQSPVPHERHITALEASQPYGDIELSIMDRVPSDAVKLYHGPPGTGKTHTLITKLTELIKSTPKNHRILVCAVSNNAVANLYVRAKAMGVQGTLCMREEKIPIGTIDSPDELERSNKNRVIFATISGRHSSQLKRIKFKIILMDEAAQAPEANVWGLLKKDVYRIIMAGDPNQLPALVSEEGMKLNHQRSLMERLMKGGYPSELLATQRRMHASIADFSNNQFYQGRLLTDYKGRPHCLRNIEPHLVINVCGRQTTIGTTYANKLEALIIKHDLIKYLEMNLDVVVIAAYQGQVELMKEMGISNVHTLDSFQGREADVVYVSTVRQGDSVGFLNDRRRLNVALTRARHVLRVVGSTRTYIGGKGVMGRYGKYMKERNLNRQIDAKMLLDMKIDLYFDEIQPIIKALPWKTVFHGRIRDDLMREPIENDFCRCIIKMAMGEKPITKNPYKEGKALVDWSIYINEETKTQELWIFGVHLVGTSTSHQTNLKKQQNKQSDEWNALCVHGGKPKTFKELPPRMKKWEKPKNNQLSREKRDHEIRKIVENAKRMAKMRNGM